VAPSSIQRDDGCKLFSNWTPSKGTISSHAVKLRGYFPSHSQPASAPEMWIGGSVMRKQSSEFIQYIEYRHEHPCLAGFGTLLCPLPSCKTGCCKTVCHRRLPHSLAMDKRDSNGSYSFQNVCHRSNKMTGSSPDIVAPWKICFLALCACYKLLTRHYCMEHMILLDIMCNVHSCGYSLAWLS
jgi:hypothetical protein